MNIQRPLGSPITLSGRASRTIIPLPLLVLRKTTVCVVGWLVLGGTILGADSRTSSSFKPLDMHVNASGFGSVNPAELTGVLQSAGSEIWRYCPRTKLGGIDVYHRTDHPQTNFKRTLGGRIAIGLASRDTFWAQYSFQFAHEFSHALANFGNNPRQLTRYSQNANLWLEESLCEAASLFTLRALSRRWQTDPPWPALRAYAPAFNAYREQRLALPEHHLPPGTPFLTWFRQIQPALRKNFALRAPNTIIATQLLPLFEATPGGWEALVFLNRDFANANQSLAQHLSQWHAQCPTDLRPFVARLAAIFAVQL